MLVLGVALMLSTQVFAQPFRYVDDQGGVHWVQSREQIPEEYRDKAETPRLPNINLHEGKPRAGADLDKLSYNQLMDRMCAGSDSVGGVGWGRGVSMETRIQCEEWLRTKARREQQLMREHERRQRRGGKE